MIDFKVDHNVFDNPNRRAKEIIKLEIDLPESSVYKGDFGLGAARCA
jgi:hypothetical protein